MQLKTESAQGKLAALAFLGLNVLAGGFHYLYQLSAARVLSPEEFGQFSGWLAWVYMGLSLGALAQYSANFFPATQKTLRTSVVLSVLLSIIVLTLFFMGLNNSVLIGVVAILIAPGVSWLLGQLQRRLLLLLFATGGLVIAVGKLGTALVIRENFYWALPLSYVLGALFLVPVLMKELKQPRSFKKTEERFLKTKLLGAAILAFAAVLIPNVDLLYVKFTQSSETLTQFAQVSLFYKVVFFVILVAAQWLLPRQLDQESQPEPQRRMKLFARVCGLGLMFALCASAIAPKFYLFVLGKEFLAPMVWVFMACFNISLLTGIFLEIQYQVSSLKVSDALACLGLQVLTVVVSVILNLDLGVYLQVQIAVNSMLLFLLFLGAGRILTGQVIK